MTTISESPESPFPTTVGNLAWFNMRTGNGVVAVLEEDGVVRRYFITQTRILESPRCIEAGDRVEFNGSTPSKPGLLPVALGVRITKKPTKIGPAATSSSEVRP